MMMTTKTVAIKDQTFFFPRVAICDSNHMELLLGKSVAWFLRKILF